MRLDYVERRFSRLFSSYIKVVVACPLPFIILPSILTAFLSIGLGSHSKAFIKDDLKLYTPTDAQAHKELQQLDSIFHINDSDAFYATRRFDVRRTGYIIITSNNESGDILNPTAMKAAMELWTVIQALTVGNSTLNYPSICVKFPIPQEFENTLSALMSTNETATDKICVSNPLVELFKLVLLSDHSILNKSVDELTIAQITNAFELDSVGISHLLGGIRLDKERKIAGAKAIMLPYALRHSTKEEDALAEKWELKLVDFLLDYNSPLIQTSWWTYETLAAESARDREQLISMLAPCFFAVSLYTIAVCCVRSWIRSRPLLAIGGVISAGMAIVSAVGLLLLGGFKMTSVAYSMPFIVFSVGVDNVFILLAAWRITNPSDSLMNRLSETFGDAAVSITVTSLTDLISFSVGCLTPFPSVQMFCVYAVVAVIFTYFYQLTFFAGIMVYTCKREAEGRHCLTFRQITPVPQHFQRSHLTNFGQLPPPRYSPTPINELKNQVKTYKKDKSFQQNCIVSQFFRTTYADFLLNAWVQRLVLVLFVAYLMIASYGCKQVQLGMEPKDLLPDNSYGKRALKITEQYFSNYGSYLHVWMYDLSTINTGHRRLWNILGKEIQLYEHTEFTGPGDSWLRAFIDYTVKNDQSLNVSSFVPLLRDSFLTQPQFVKYKRDVRFTTDQLLLEASRVPVQLRHVGSKNQSKAMRLFRHLAHTSEIPSGVYADFFQFAEQYNAVLPGTLSSVAIAGVAVIIVSLLLIPQPIAAFWVSVSIISINIGILGFMTFWSVRLDFISMVTIVMSIGFCVDFASHIAYNFAKGANITPEERVRNALYAVGTPILQSASSTILGVSFLSSTESYVFSSFFKTIILVIVLGVLHGLVILPVLLTIFSSKHADNKDSESVKKEIPPSEAFNQLKPTYSSYHLYRQPHIFKPYGNSRRVSVDSSLNSSSEPSSLQLYQPWATNTPSPQINNNSPPIIPPRMSSSYGPLRQASQTLSYFQNYTENPTASEHYFVPIQTILKPSSSNGGMAH